MSHTIAAVALPRPSLVEHAMAPLDYADAFAVEVPTGTFGDVDTLARECTRLPRWVEGLMWLRHRLVRPFGLRVPPGGVQREHEQAASSVGIFPVLARSERELLMGLNDSHLDFRFSLLIQRSGQCERAIATTTVKYNNGWGRLYFAVVKPFHRLIIQAMLRGAVRRRASAP